MIKLAEIKFRDYVFKKPGRRQFDTLEEFFDFFAQKGEFTKKLRIPIKSCSCEDKEKCKHPIDSFVYKKEPYQIHPKQLAWYQLFTQKNFKVSCLLASRWKGKSDIVTMLMAAWYIYKNPFASIGIVTKTTKRANTLADKVARLLTAANLPMIKDAHGDWWYREENMGHTPTVAKTSLKQPIRGTRFDVLIFDDILSAKDRRSAAAIAEVDEFFDESITIAERVIVVGQLVSKHDLHYRLKTAQDVFLMESWYGDIPEIERPLEEFKNLPKERIASDFLGYINDEEEAIFRSVEVDSRPIDNYRYAVVDPSLRGKDYTALAIGWIINGDLIIWGKVWKMSWGDCLADLIKLTKNCEAVWIEENAIGPTFTQRFIEAGIPAKGFTSTKNKKDKIMGLRGLIRSGRLKFYQGLGEEEKSQLYNWTEAAQHDDLPDAVAMLAQHMGVLMIKQE